MQRAICYAQICHSRLSMLHANNANAAFDRVLNFFPNPRTISGCSIGRSIFAPSFRSVAQLQKRRGSAGGENILLNIPFTSDLIAGALSRR